MTTDTINDAVTMAGGEGMLLAGRYRIVRKLGQGGMGSVWLAEDTQLDGKQFAIKMLPSVLVSNRRAYAQLKSEALVSMKLAHTNIVTLRAFEDNNGNPFLVMDYIDGQTLDDYLAEKGKFTEGETVKLLKPVAAALDYAHGEGVVHRDVKPANVMIRKDGHPYILDFGIAREIQETMTRVTGKLSSGTLLYMSPEQLRGQSPKPEQDVYSFSAMVYECIAGHPPFYRGAVEDQIKNETPELLPASIVIAHSVMAGLDKDPKARPSSCADVLVPHGRPCPRSWSNATTIESEPEPIKPDLPFKSNRTLWWIVGSFIVFAVLAAGVYWWKVAPPRDIATRPFVPDVSTVAVSPVKVEPTAPSLPEQTHIEEEQDRLKAEAARLRAGIFAQCRLATNAFEQIAEYREPADGFQHHLVKVDSLWKDVTEAELPDDASPEQLTTALMSVSNAVVGIQVEARWLEENRKTRDEILAVRKAADGLCDRLAGLKGNHWQTLQSYIDGTNTLTGASERLANGELASALESMAIATNHLQTAYSDELTFIDDADKTLTLQERLNSVSNIVSDQRCDIVCSQENAQQRDEVECQIAEVNEVAEDSGDVKAGEIKEITLPGGTIVEFCWCPPGEFYMGASKNDPFRAIYEPEARYAKITNGYYIGKYEVTVEQWNSMKNCDEDTVAHSGGKFPIHSVSWHDITNMVCKLNSEINLNGILAIPSEMEWEYAYRAGTTTPFYWGSVPETGHGAFINSGDYRKEYCLNEVGQYCTNGWGICDMAGNVQEWCRDEVDGKRVVRGGSYLDVGHRCRASSWRLMNPYIKRKDTGFRLLFYPHTNQERNMQ